jgi:phosphatidylglycerol:prolipoprotein diacylglycerol transferase
MLPTLNIGPLAIPTAGLVYILGIWLTLFAVEKAASLLELRVNDIYNLATVALVAGFVTARLTFVATYWSAFEDNLLGIVWPLNAGFSVWAGLLGGAAAAFFYGRAKQLESESTLDALAPGLLVALMTVSLADMLAGPGYGTAADLLWSINLFGVERHPVQLYELLIGLAALLAWLYLVRRPHRSAQPFLVAIAVYSAGRLFVDAFRANAWLSAGGYHILQIIALVILLAALFLLGRRAEMAELD